MKLTPKRAMLAALSLLALSAPSVMATSASASATPVVYVNGTGNWGHPSVRPSWILVGNGGAPVAHTWYWNTWNSEDAKSTGTLWIDSCVPNCTYGKESYRHLLVTLSGVKYHDGQPYYSVMTWYTPGYRLYGYRTSTATLHFSTEGGTIPVWH